MIDHDHDRIIAVGNREVCDEIHGDLREGAGRRGGDRSQRGSRRVRDNFHLLAYSAAINVLPDIGAHTWPPIGFLHVPFGGRASRVSGSGMIMVELEDTFTEIRRDISAISIEQNTVSESPIGEGGLHRRGANTIQSLKGCLDRQIVGRFR